MTDKFTICNMGLNGSFIKENGKIMEIERVVDLLNEQHEQIERLKDNFRVLDEVKCELADENEQLKRSVQYWYAEHKRIVNNYVDKIKEVEKENEQLKQHNTELINKIDFLERIIEGDVE